jgi:hypothetical protein
VVGEEVDWAGFRALTPEELEWLHPLEFIPENLLHYRILVPTQTDIAAFLTSLNVSRTQGGGIVSGPGAGGVDCSTLRPTSPLGGMDYGRNTFYWDAAPGATSYQVNVYDENGGLAASGQTGGSETNLSIDVLGQSGFTYSWEVSALVNGQVACTTARVSMFRVPAPPPPDQEPDGPICGNPNVCESGETYPTCVECG